MGQRYYYDPGLALSHTAAQAHCSKTYGGGRPARAHLAYPSTQRQQEALLGWLRSLPPPSALKTQYDSTRSRVSTSSTSSRYYAAGSLPAVTLRHLRCPDLRACPLLQPWQPHRRPPTRLPTRHGATPRRHLGGPAHRVHRLPAAGVQGAGRVVAHAAGPLDPGQRLQEQHARVAPRLVQRAGRAACHLGARRAGRRLRAGAARLPHLGSRLLLRLRPLLRLLLLRPLLRLLLLLRLLRALSCCRHCRWPSWPRGLLGH
jgi:hypothetical protein